MKFLKIQKKNAEKKIKELKEKKIIDKQYKVESLEKHVLIPIKKNKIKEVKGKIIEKKGKKVKKIPRLKEELLKVLTKKEMKIFHYKSFDVIGNIIQIMIPKELKKKEKMIGEAFLKCIPNSRVIVKKVSETTGVERVRRVKVIAGEKRTQTIHVENDCKYKLNLNKVFFTGRLSNERLRIIKQVKKNEIVYDLFCGVGPYAIPIAKKCKKVVANDINEHAIHYLKENLKLNKIKNISVYNENANEFTKELVKKEGKPSRIIMNLPKTSELFLNAMIKLSEKNTIIHYYTFWGKDKKNKLEGIRIAFKKNNKKYKILGIHKCGDYAPGVGRYCVDIKVLN